MSFKQQQQQQSQQQQQLIYLKRQSTFINQILHHQQQRPNTNQSNNDLFCLYPHRFCLQNRIDGFNYCIRHILFDKNAPFKQCSYIHPQTNKRCSKAARRYDRRDRDTAFCPWHIQQFNLLRRKNACIEYYNQNQLQSDDRKNNLKRKFDELEHYCPNNEHDHRRKNGDWELNEYKSVVLSKSLKQRINDSINLINYQNQQNDLFSKLMLCDVLNNIDTSLDSDYSESVESYMDDPLRHAGVYSAEEISHILRDKMLRLQTLYINLLNYYRQMLKQKMRLYYLSRISIASNNNNNKEYDFDNNNSNGHNNNDNSSNHNNNNKSLELSTNLLTHDNTTTTSTTVATTTTTIFDGINDDEDYKIMKAMFKYHNISGSEKLIQNKAMEIRQKLIENNNDDNKSKSTSTTILNCCIYKKDLQQCQKQCVPLSNYCRTHILYDPYQILFRPCANGEPPCLQPIISYVHRNSCLQHTNIKFDKNEIVQIMKSPEKSESDCHHLHNEQSTNNNNNNNNNNNHDNDNVNVVDDDVNDETELFHTIDDISMAMETVESENLFSLEHGFDIDSNILS